MMLGKVIGQVWTNKRVAGLGSEKILLVQELGAKDIPTGRIVVAADNLGAAQGHIVTVSWGSGARAVIKTPDNRHVLVEAAISRIVDGKED
jgi:microcompartment protein CcmK/EutM